MAENIRFDRGPLGAQHPDVAWGPEGDTPLLLSCIPNGPNEPTQLIRSSWGGLYELYPPGLMFQKRPFYSPYYPEGRLIWANTKDSYSLYLPSEYGSSGKKDTFFFNED